jgi:hypothetical protein
MEGKIRYNREFLRVNVDEDPSPKHAQSNQATQVSAPPPQQALLVRLTDTPIQIIAIYLFVTLALPALLLEISDLWPFYYRYENFSVLEGIAVFGAILVACVFRHTQWTRKAEVELTPRTVFIYSNQNLRIAGLVLAIFVAILNFANSGFRYDEFGLSEKGSLSLYIYAIVPACVKLLLIYHVFIYRGTSAKDRLERALVTFAFLVSINGSGTAFVAVFSLIALQTNAGDYLFKSKIAGASYLRLAFLVTMGFALLALVSLLLIGAFIYGESVKREVPVESVVGSLNVDWSWDYLIERSAPPYASLVNTLPLTFDFEQDSLSNLGGVWNTFLFRLDALGIANFDVARLSAKAIMRSNLEYISSVDLTEREGTAPGLIPGFLYCFPPVLNVLMLGAYVFMALGILQRLCLCMNDELSFIGKFILAFFTLPLFESPIDLLVIIDDGFIFFVGLWWMGRLVKVHPVSAPLSQPEPTSARLEFGP